MIRVDREYVSHDVTQQVVRAILAADPTDALAIIAQWGRDHGYQAAVGDVLEPALEQIGGHWSSPEGEMVNLARAYVAGKVAEEVLGRIAADQESNGSPVDRRPVGRVAVGNVEDDCHAHMADELAQSGAPGRTAGHDCADVLPIPIESLEALSGFMDLPHEVMPVSLTFLLAEIETALEALSDNEH